MTAMPVRKYNPGFLSDDELVASFCVRTHEFESLIEALRGCTGDSNQHQVVIGPRGSGKTSLLLRVAAELRRDADLAAGFFPIVFAEESYEVGTAGEFWLECLERLAIQAPEREDAPDLHTTLADLRTIHDDRTLAARCLATLLDFADRERKRLVLMVENLNMMFEDMVGRDAGWRLRHVLQTEPRIVLLASATSRFDEIDHPHHAMYDQFRVLTLRRLNTDECAVLWKVVSGQSRPTDTIRPLEIFTGGSPRLLAIVARFGAGLSFRDLMESLFNLVDDHTEYFKSHLESLPAQERRVYLALADLWKPALTKEVAERARIETSKCSAQLARLMERGVVQLDGGSPRRKQYYLSERMYNIYYLLRRGKERLVEALIRFIESYYSPDKLKEIGARIAREAEDVVPEMRSLYQSAAARLMAMSARAHEHDKGHMTRTATSDPELMEVEALFRKGVRYLDRDDHEESLAAFTELLRRFREIQRPAFSAMVIMAFMGSGTALFAMNRWEEALVNYDEALRRFDDIGTPPLLESVGAMFVGRATVLFALDRREEAIAAYDEVVRRFNDSETQEAHRYMATAIIGKGAVLAKSNRLEGALAVHNEVLDRFGKVNAPGVVECVVMALVGKGAILHKLDRHEEAVAAFDEMLSRFGERQAPNFRKSVAIALVSKGSVLVALNRREEAMAAYDEVQRRFGDSETPELLEQVAKALINKAQVFAKSNRARALSIVGVLLHILAKLGLVPAPVLGPLVAVSNDLGTKPILDLIKESPADDLLLPLTTALEREIGQDPRVPQEVSEVAEDIRRDLAKMRETRNLAT